MKKDLKNTLEKMKRNNNILLFIICLICLNSCKSNSPKENKDNIIAVSKIASDNGDDTLYVETLLRSDHEKLTEYEKEYNNLFYYSKIRNEKLILEKTDERILEIISVFEYEFKISIIYHNYAGGLTFRSYVFNEPTICKDEKTWCLAYRSGFNMPGQDGIKFVGWLEPIIFYTEPLRKSSSKLIQAYIGRGLRVVAKDEETINHKYFDYKKSPYKNKFSKYFSNKSWENTLDYKLEYDEELKEYIRKNVKKN